MKNFARISITLVTLAGLAGIASAQGAGSAKAPAPAPTSKTPAPAPAPVAPPLDKKAAPEPMPAPKPAPEIAAAFKAATGTWKCDGIMMGGADMKTEVKTKGTYKSKLDLDGFWISSTFAETKKGGYKLTTFTTFDAAGKKWNRVLVDNMGGHELSSSTGMAGNKMLWEGTSNGMGMSMKARHTEETVSAKEVKMWGEYSMDGKTFTKMYDLTCKK